MRTVHCVLCLWFTLLVSFVGGQFGGNYSLSVELFTYSNPSGRLANEECCTPGRRQSCSMPCTNTFTFCLRGSDNGKCSFGRFQSFGIRRDTIDFQNDAARFLIPNPMDFTNITNVDSIQLSITVTATELVDEYFVTIPLNNGFSTEQVTLSGQNGVAELELRVHVNCAANHFGADCNILCSTGDINTCKGVSSSLGPHSRAVVGIIVTILLLLLIGAGVLAVVITVKKLHLFERREVAMVGIPNQGATEPGHNPNYSGETSEPVSSTPPGAITRAERSDSHGYEHIASDDSSQGKMEGSANQHKYEYISNDDRTCAQGGREGGGGGGGGKGAEGQNSYSYVATAGGSPQQQSSTAPPTSSGGVVNGTPGHYETAENYTRDTEPLQSGTTFSSSVLSDIPADYETIDAASADTTACQ